jgi:hypothetical protein
MTDRLRRHHGLLLAGLALAPLGGCVTAPAQNETAVRTYYDYRFGITRESLRTDAARHRDDQVLLNNMRLGLASLADGDLEEAETSLSFAFDLLSTAGLNADRTTAAVLLHEGVRIWKGEPFEQALSYHWVATLYALKGDWENARAASANAMFRLTDFGSAKYPSDLIERAASDPKYLEEGYTAVDTDFALGFVMLGLASDLSGTGDAEAAWKAALEIDPDLEPLIGVLRDGSFNTLLLVDYGKGPTKVATGPDGAIARFVEHERAERPLRITADGEEIGVVWPVCNVNEMARDLRWNNLEDVRRAKSVLGNMLVYSGAAVTAGSSRNRNLDGTLIGAGMMLIGMLVKAGARADTRHLEFSPQSVYLVPLWLREGETLRVARADTSVATMELPSIRPGTPRAPHVIYLRLHDSKSRRRGWLTETHLFYGNDHAGVRPGDYPWILGGTDVSTPTRETLRAYQVGGRLTGMSVRDLRGLYAAEGIEVGGGGGQRHVLEGGRGLFTPQPDSMGYKRLMYAPHRPYVPRSDLVRNAAATMRVQNRKLLLEGRP